MTQNGQTGDTTARRSKAGTVALACGIAALPMMLTGYTVILMPILGVVAIGVGSYALRKTDSPRTRSKAGIVLGGFAVGVTLLMAVFVYRAVQLSIITPDEYARIRSGMTYEQTWRVVGAPGQKIPVPGVGALYEGYRWYGREPGTGAVIVFVDGKVFAKQHRGMVPGEAISTPAPTR